VTTSRLTSVEKLLVAHDAVVLHELAHFHRGDRLVQFFAVVCMTVFLQHSGVCIAHISPAAELGSKKSDDPVSSPANSEWPTAAGE
jgi:hypothetical protein